MSKQFDNNNKQIMKKYRLRVKSFVKQSILTSTFFPQRYDLFIHLFQSIVHGYIIYMLDSGLFPCPILDLVCR